jgi:hypothetical protein
VTVCKKCSEHRAQTLNQGIVVLERIIESCDPDRVRHMTRAFIESLKLEVRKIDRAAWRPVLSVEPIIGRRELCHVCSEPAEFLVQSKIAYWTGHTAVCRSHAWGLTAGLADWELESVDDADERETLDESQESDDTIQ